MRVLVASDKFKGTVSSADVAAAVGDGVRGVCPQAVVESVLVADGGDGTLAAAVAAGFELVPVVAAGPTGEAVRSGFARRGETAVVELADVSGLIRLPGGEPRPLTATSRGTGEVIAAAIDSGCTRVIVGIGGSASTDGGAGLIRALGARVLDAAGAEVAEGGEALGTASSLEVSAVNDRLKGVEIVVACDVDNPLTGPSGAAATYGPQKGATPEQVAVLEAALGHWADLIAGQPDLRLAPGAGAAGGVGFAALAVLGAKLAPGIELMLELVGFRDRLAGVDLVVTGEGALDEQTLRGKAVAGVAAAASAAGIPVVAVCGTNRLDAERLEQGGIDAAYALTDLQPDVRRCIADPVPLLRRLGERIAVERLGPTMRATERGLI
ncbi:glycerate kinase [Kribbella sp. ALI-6-A]|uniref:glycerate kinase n=1 Tax=Kribbella sp. ALI-6-A TaxID=1933817 RepID=UPI00097C55B7|nr:glycerate kinase [Kribbella sp. ALI-6-A]ONI73834.1 glycerate kinase [Kribbella sp. ALI-6-A]